MSIKQYWPHEKLNIERKNLKTEGTNNGYVALLAPRTRYNSRNGMELTDTYQTQHPFSYRTATRDKKKTKRCEKHGETLRRLNRIFRFIFGDGRYRSQLEGHDFAKINSQGAG